MTIIWKFALLLNKRKKAWHCKYTHFAEITLHSLTVKEKKGKLFVRGGSEVENTCFPRKMPPLRFSNLLPFVFQSFSDFAGNQ